MFTANEPVIMNAELYNAAYEPVNESEVSVTLKDEAGKEFPYAFRASGKAYRLDAGRLPAGRYTWEARTELNGERFSAKGELNVRQLFVERMNTVADHTLLADLAALVGQEIGTSDWLVVDQARIDAFAACTGDHQWIHVDPAAAAQGPYGGTVAHGFLTLSLVPQLFASGFAIDDVTMGINYGLNRVRFPAPVPAGSRVRGHFQLQAFEPLPGGAQLVVLATVEVEGQAKPGCVAETVSRRFVG